jgi:hypothetical protein
MKERPDILITSIKGECSEIYVEYNLFSYFPLLLFPLAMRLTSVDSSIRKLQINQVYEFIMSLPHGCFVGYAEIKVRKYLIWVSLLF